LQLAALEEAYEVAEIRCTMNGAEIEFHGVEGENGKY